MSHVPKLISIVGLALTVGPSFLVFAEVMAWSTHAALMLVGAVLWFGSAPFWLGRHTDGPGA